MQVKAIKTRIFEENEDLLEFILKYVKKIPEKSILVVTSKIVALSEGRIVEFKNAREKTRQKIKLIKKESDFAIKTKLSWLTIKDGMVMANAGIDESNANGRLILSPQNSFASAELIRRKLKKIFKIKNLGVIISDSGLLPLRSGVIGMALGYTGFSGVKDYKKKKDIFDREFLYQKINIADSLVTASIVCMGEGRECQPLALITNAPINFTNEKVDRQELIINPKEDIYAPLFTGLDL